MENSPAWAMLFTALVSVGLIGYVTFRIARGFCRWAMGRPVGGRRSFHARGTDTNLFDSRFDSTDQASFLRSDFSSTVLTGDPWSSDVLGDTRANYKDLPGNIDWYSSKHD